MKAEIVFVWIQVAGLCRADLCVTLGCKTRSLPTQIKLLLLGLATPRRVTSRHQATGGTRWLHLPARPLPRLQLLSIKSYYK